MMQLAASRLGRFVGAIAMWLAVGTAAPAQDKDKAKEGKAPAAKVGLSINDPKAFQGYTIMSPLRSKTTYLLDMNGRVAHSWTGAANPALVPFLLENGNLLRMTEALGEAKKFKGIGPGQGGRIQEITWDGEIVWDFIYNSETRMPHHDSVRLPNGNLVMIVSQYKTKDEAIAMGRRPSFLGSHLQPDSLVEIKPTGKNTGEVVWEWSLWDHLVQEFDETKPNYGKVAEHPELVDLNYSNNAPPPPKKDGKDKDKIDKGKDEKAKGKDDGKAAPKLKGGASPDWTHFNGVNYNPELDQLIISVHAFSEFWIIDHSTTTAEAASHKGGKSGKGGDLLYRWGNPRTYGAGDRKDQRLFSQHNAQWIPKGHPGEGHILVFNNGPGRPDGAYSSVDEIVPPVDAQGRYSLKAGSAYGPEQAAWSYTAPKKTDFFSNFISGAQRLPNGNTLICAGASGTLFEVTPDKEIVWKYVNPLRDAPAKGKGPPKGPGDARPGQVLAASTQGALKLSDDQKKQVLDLQKDVAEQLDKILTEPQSKELASLKPGPPGFGDPPLPGQILPAFVQGKLKLADDQKTRVTALQQETDGKLGAILTDEQRKLLKTMLAGPPGFPAGGGGGQSAANVFRVYRFAPTYPGLKGRDLTATKTVEELLSKEAKGK
jgi:hypothetical protein